MKVALVIAFTVVASIPVWLATQWPQQQALDLEMDQVKERHRVYASSLATALERYHDDVVATFRFFEMTFRDMKDVSRQGSMRLLDDLGFRHVCSFDFMTGTLIDSAALPGSECPPVAPQKKLEMFRAEAVEDRITLSSVALTPANEPVLFLMQRRGDAVIIAALKTTYFREIGKTVEFGEGGHAAIIDHTGTLLWHPRPDWMVPPRSIAKLDIVQKMIAGERGFTEFFSPAAEEVMLAGYAGVEGAGWGVMVPQPKREIEAQIARITKSTVFVYLIGLALAFMLALVLAHFLLDPLRRIRIGAERFGNGFGDALIPPHGAGRLLSEVNDLRAAFNAMVLRVRNAQRTETFARKEAQEANRVKSRFLANMSHELRTPLNAIIGFAEVTKRRLDAGSHERESEYLGYIHDAGRHLLDLINDLLDLSRIEAGAHPLKEIDVDVGEVMREVTSTLMPMASEKRIVVRVELPPSPLILRADARSLKQMILNLGSNAIRYIQDGGEVTIAAERTPESGIVLSVSDNGPGISADELANIRKPFTRSRVHERSSLPGTGLGLSIVDALATLHQATFELQSTVGRGTVARLSFPPGRTKPHERDSWILTGTPSS